MSGKVLFVEGRTLIKVKTKSMVEGSKTDAGMTPSTGAEDLHHQIHIDDIDQKSPTEIANFINSAFLDPMKSYQPLTSLPPPPPPSTQTTPSCNSKK